MPSHILNKKNKSKLGTKRKVKKNQGKKITIRIYIRKCNIFLNHIIKKSLCLEYNHSSDTSSEFIYDNVFLQCLGL